METSAHGTEPTFSAELAGVLDTLLGKAPFGMALFDRDLAYLWVNTALAQQNGRSAGDHAGVAFLELFPELEATFLPLLERVRDEGVGLEIDIEGPVPGAGGAVGSATTALYPVVDADGTAHGVGVVVVDTTDRVQSDRRRAAAAALLDTVLRTAPVGFALLDDDLRIVRINDTLAAIDGIPVAKHLGRPATEVFPALHESVGPLVERVLVTGEPVVDLEVTGENRRGDHIEVLLSCFPVPGEVVGTQIGIVVVDVTERNRIRAVEDQALRSRLERQAAALDVLQRGLLPRSLPAVPGIELDARYLAVADEVQVGGDWYDAFVPPATGRLYLAVGDVAGHGLGSVETMGQLRNAARGWFLDGEEAAEVLARLNRLLLATEPGQIATLVVATYDPVTAVATLALAGHPPPMVARRDGSVETVAVRPGPPLGVLDDPSFATVEVAIAEGDTFFLYTDGLVERRDESLDVGLARLAAGLGAGAVEPVSDLLGRVLESTLPPTGRFDDVCAVALRRVRKR